MNRSITPAYTGGVVRVLEIPPSSGQFHFNGPEAQTWIEVDWFRDDPQPGSLDWSTPGGRAGATEFIKAHRYFDPKKAYLVLHPQHPFLIGYDAQTKVPSPSDTATVDRFYAGEIDPPSIMNAEGGP